jgi:plasmid stabilization system protein ParE
VTPTVVFTPEARADIASAATWYRGRSVRASENFLFAIGVAVARMEAQPTANVVIDAETGARRALLRRYPHRLLYMIEGERVVVFAVISHYRDDPAWRDRLR